MPTTETASKIKLTADDLDRYAQLDAARLQFQREASSRKREQDILEKHFRAFLEQEAAREAKRKNFRVSLKEAAGSPRWADEFLKLARECLGDEAQDRVDEIKRNTPARQVIVVESL